MAIKTIGARRALTVIVGAAVAALFFLGGTAFGFAAFTGGSNVSTRVVTQEVPLSISSPVFVTLTGSPIAFNVPSGTTRLFDARFNAESRCSGGAVGSFCTARIVVRNTKTNEVLELHPVALADFAFDSQGADPIGDLSEAHAIERFIRLRAGSYSFVVQLRTTSTGTTFQVDDWAFSVDMRI